MTIDRYTFNPPLRIRNEFAPINLDSLRLPFTRRTIPSGQEINVTPTGFSDKFILRTMSSEIDGHQNTIGELECTAGTWFRRIFFKKEKISIPHRNHVLPIVRIQQRDALTSEYLVYEAFRYTPDSK